MPKPGARTPIAQLRSILDAGFLFIILVVVIGVCFKVMIRGFKKHWVKENQDPSISL